MSETHEKVRSAVAGDPFARLDATAQAANLLQSDCPTAQPLTVPGRLAAMEQRLDAMLRAVELVQPALERFYGALSDEQKERFNRLTPAQG